MIRKGSVYSKGSGNVVENFALYSLFKATETELDRITREGLSIFQGACIDMQQCSSITKLLTGNGFHSDYARSDIDIGMEMRVFSRFREDALSVKGTFSLWIFESTECDYCSKEMQSLALSSCTKRLYLDITMEETTRKLCAYHERLWLLEHRIRGIEILA